MKTLHRAAAIVAMSCLLTFWTATVYSMARGDAALTAEVKRAIAWGLLLMMPAMMALGGTGFSLGWHRTGALIGRKARRMRIVAANGLFVLVPAAVWLAWRASQGAFGSIYLAVQSIELVAGSCNLVLMLLNARDGWRLNRAVPAAL